MPTAALPIELSRRMEAADAYEAAAGLRGLAARLGQDTAGVAVGEFGRAVAVTAHCLPTSLYNRVMGFDAAALDALDDIIAFYRTRDTPARFDLVPDFATPDVTAGLRARGFEHRTKSIFSNLMMSRPPTADIPPPPPGVRIRQVERGEAKLLGDTHAAGLTYPSPTRDYLGLQLETRLADPVTTGFLAEIDGEPAATGLLTIVDGIGYLGHASTIPAFRGRGCQTALIVARQARAAMMNCDRVVTFPVPGTASHRNVERCGFTLAHRIQVWMDEDVERE